MVDRRDGVDGVGVGERGRRGGAERRERPAPVGDPVRAGALALAGEEDEGEVAGAARVGRVPGRELDLVGVDPLHVDRRRRAEVALLAAAAEHQHLADAGLAGAARRARGRRRSAVTSPSSASRSTGAVGAQQHGDRAEAAQRRDDRERARPRAHQHADVLALADAEREQAADDVVDAVLDRGRGCRRGPRTGRRRRPARSRACSSSSRPSEIARVAGCSRPRRARRGSWPVTSSASDPSAAGRPRDGAAERAREPGADAGRELERRSRAACARPACRRRARSRPTRLISAGSSPSPARQRVQPATAGQVVCDGRRADDEAEVAGAKRDLVDLGARRGAGDRADRRRRARSRRPRRRRSGSGRSMSASVTRRSSITKPPWSIRLWATNWRMKSASAGPGPGDPALALQEAPLALARQQRLAVVELAQEVDPLAQRLDRVEQAEARCGSSRRAPRCARRRRRAARRRPRRPPRGARAAARRGCRRGCRR